MLIRSLLMLIAIYGVLLVVLFVFQSRLVFLPHIAGRSLVSTPSAIGLEYRELWLDTGDGQRLHAWWIPHPQARGVVHFSHGNAGNISHRLDSLRIFHELGLSVLIYDYRGYGLSSGRPGEAGSYRDAETAWRWLIDEAAVPPERIMLFGRSMGGAVAAQLATRVAPGALILESSFTSVPDIAAEIYWWLPVRWLTRIRLPALAALSETQQPTLVIHSRNDEIVPFSHGQRLFEAAPEPRQLLTLSGSHNTGFLESIADYRAGLDAFVSERFGP